MFYYCEAPDGSNRIYDAPGSCPETGKTLKPLSDLDTIDAIRKQAVHAHDADLQLAALEQEWNHSRQEIEKRERERIAAVERLQAEESSKKAAAERAATEKRDRLKRYLGQAVLASAKSNRIGIIFDNLKSVPEIMLPALESSKLDGKVLDLHSVTQHFVGDGLFERAWAEDAGVFTDLDFGNYFTKVVLIQSTVTETVNEALGGVVTVKCALSLKCYDPQTATWLTLPALEQKGLGHSSRASASDAAAKLAELIRDQILPKIEQ